MKKFFITILVSLLGIASVSSAATLSPQSPDRASIGERITVDVVVDLGNESINSADITLHYPTGVLRFDGYDTKAGVLSLWVTPPTSDGQVVRFSGISPGGIERIYDPQHPDDHRITLARLFFVSTRSGTATLDLAGSTLLRNDGRGTAVSLAIMPRTISIGTETVSAVPDTEQPEPFTIAVVGEASLGKNPRLATFTAVDMEGGIEHYEVSINDRMWHRATSPFPLPNRIFSYTFSVRAFDFSGNYQEQSITVPGQHPERAIFIGILLVLILGFFLNKRRI